MIAAQIQASKKWKLEDEIQKMQFSKNWFVRFKLRFHIKYKLIQGNKVFISKGDTLLEQKRLLTGKMSKYPLSQRFNFDESSIEENWNGPRSFVSPEMEEYAQKGSQKGRITTAAFSSATGEVILPIYITRSHSHSWKKNWITCVKTPKFTKRTYRNSTSSAFTIYTNQKAWMTKAIMEDVLKKIEFLSLNCQSLIETRNSANHNLFFV
jgi:hypothetical protein